MRSNKSNEFKMITKLAHFKVNESADNLTPQAQKFLDIIRIADNTIELKNVTVEATPKGNWAVYNKGSKLMTVSGSLLDDETIMKYELEHHDANESIISSMNEAKFTFKTEKPTGRFGSFYNAHHYIKLNGKEVGKIDSKSPFHVGFMVMKNGTTVVDNNPNCLWKWITFAKDFESIDAAKIWVNENIGMITSKYELRCDTDETK